MFGEKDICFKDAHFMVGKNFFSTLQLLTYFPIIENKRSFTHIHTLDLFYVNRFF